MNKLFGANWKTSISGLVTVAATVISAKPDLIAFLPDSIEGTTSGIAGLIAAISAGYFALNTKDKNVTGGTVQQTASGNVAVNSSQSSSVNDTITAMPK